MTRSTKLVLAVDLGGTQFRVALADERGEIRKRYAAPVERPEDPAATMRAIADAATAIVSGEDRASVCGVGVAVAGLVVPERGVLLTSPNLPAWYGTPLKEIWERDLGLPVLVGNDANLAALGERRFGAGKRSDDMVYVTVSTGIGGGVITGGRMLLGSSGFAAEIGHMTIDTNGPECNCGNTGCLEMLASGTAIARFAAERLSAGEASSMTALAGGKQGAITARLVADAAGAGDRLARDVMRTAGWYLGVGLVNLIHIFNPELIVIGGGVSNAGDLLLGPARQVVAERAMKDMKVRITLAELGDDPGLLGAVALVLESGV